MKYPRNSAASWNHGHAFLGPNQATEAKVYKWKVGNRWPDHIGDEVIDPKTYDVHGGYWDAGDLNKYTSNTVNVQNMLLMAYEMAMVKGGPKDKDLNIPESGNRIPDELDEIRVGTEFLLRDNDGTGAAFGRVHQESGSPPETVTAAVQLTMPNSEVTMGRAAALAYAAVVWSESQTRQRLRRRNALPRSMKSWKLLERKPHPWPVDPKNPKKILSQGEMRGDADYSNWQAVAAAAYFRLTGKKEFDDIVHADLAKRNLVQRRQRSGAMDLHPHERRRPGPRRHDHKRQSSPPPIPRSINSKAEATASSCRATGGAAIRPSANTAARSSSAPSSPTTAPSEKPISTAPKITSTISTAATRAANAISRT